MRMCELLVAVGLVAGCVVKEDLGETAGEGGESGSDGESGEPASTATDSGGSLPGMTGEPGEGSSGSSNEGDESESGATGDSGDGGPLGACDIHPEAMQHDPIPGRDQPIPGLEAFETAVLDGPCMMTYADIPEDRSDSPDTERFGLVLDCILDGSLDGEPVVAEPSMLLFPMAAWEIDPQALPMAAAQDVRLRLAHALIGFGLNTWLVVEREDGTILLDSISAIRLDPTDPDIPFAPEVSDLLAGAPWHGGLEMSTVATRCDSIDNGCGAIQRAMELGWEGGPPVRLELWQTGTIPTDLEETSYRATMGRAVEYPRPECVDTPDAYHRLTIWAEEP
jgi:hypothetical protein